MPLILLFHGGHIGLNNNIDGIIPAEEMRQQTMENVELNIYNYFNEYKNFFIKRINEQASNGYYSFSYEPENPEWLANTHITALNLVCDRFSEAGYKVEKRTSRRYNTEHVQIDKIIIRWN